MLFQNLKSPSAPSDSVLKGMSDFAEGRVVVRLVVFALARQRYGLALTAVERVLPMVAVSPLPGCPAAVLGAINVHGEIVAVVDLRQCFGLPAGEYGPGARLLLARTPQRVVGLPVDEVVGMVELPEDAVVEPDAVTAGIAHVSGIAKLADGVLLIQDLDSLLSGEEERVLAASLGNEQI